MARQANVANVLLQGVRDQRKHLLALIQQQHDTQVSQTFVSETGTCYELKAFDLTEVGLEAEHVNVEEFGDIVVSCVGVLFTEGGAYSGGLLFDQSTLICDGLSNGCEYGRLARNWIGKATRLACPNALDQSWLTRQDSD